MSLWLKRELLGIGTLAMLARAHAEENGTLTPPRGPAVFLTHASPVSYIAADSDIINSAFVKSRRTMGPSTRSLCSLAQGDLLYIS
jgi:hypothetical protein